MAKLTKKDKKMRKIAFLSLILSVIIYSMILLLAYNKNENKFEYFKNDKLYSSKDCYLSKDIAYCKNGKVYIAVDGFYAKK